MGGSPGRNYHRRRGRPRNAAAQQEVFPMETVAGVFRVLQPARADRLRAPSCLNGVSEVAAREWWRTSSRLERDRHSHSNLSGTSVQKLDWPYRGQSQPNVPAVSKL